MPYTFCPECGARLADRLVDERTRRACDQCDFVDYENERPCVGVLVLDEKRVLLVQRAVEPFKGCWDVPGGFLDSDEHPADAVHREMLEETELEVEPAEVLGFWVDAYGDSGYNTLNICYLARVTGGAPKPGSDAAALEWFALDALPEKLAFTWVQEALEALRKRLAS